MVLVSISVGWAVRRLSATETWVCADRFLRLVIVLLSRVVNREGIKV